MNNFLFLLLKWIAAILCFVMAGGFGYTAWTSYGIAFAISLMFSIMAFFGGLLVLGMEQNSEEELQ